MNKLQELAKQLEYQDTKDFFFDNQYRINAQSPTLYKVGRWKFDFEHVCNCDRDSHCCLGKKIIAIEDTRDKYCSYISRFRNPNEKGDEKRNESNI